MIHARLVDLVPSSAFPVGRGVGCMTNDSPPRYGRLSISRWVACAVCCSNNTYPPGAGQKAGLFEVEFNILLGVRRNIVSYSSPSSFSELRLPALLTGTFLLPRAPPGFVRPPGAGTRFHVARGSSSSSVCGSSPLSFVLWASGASF
jgi:hypothetical protein